MTEPIEPISAEVKRFTMGLLEKASHQNLSDLFASRPPEALYYLPNRNGVSVLLVPTTGLTTEQMVKLLRYRLAQYIQIGFVDAQVIYERGWEYEPLSFLGPDDIHLIAVAADTGEILCYASLWSLPRDAPEVTLKERERPIFPVEEDFGWGIYNKLAILPHLPINRIMELKRFVKNQSLSAFDERGIRAPTEMGIGLVEVVTGVLRSRADAMVGSLEEHVGKRNLDFFHIPLVLIHGAMPYAEDTDYLLPHFRDTESYPFATLFSDVSGPVLPRTRQVELALEQPGKRGLLALLQLKNEVTTRKSSLIPPRGLDAFTETVIAQKEISMPVRRQMRSLGNELRHFDLFEGLSTADATMLRMLMENVEAAPGELIVRQGEAGDALYLIEEGRVDVMAHRASGDIIHVGQLGPGEYFGEIGLLSGGLRTADVVAAVPTRLLKLSREMFIRYLAERSEVEQQMASVAARRIVDTSRKIARPGSE